MKHICEGTGTRVVLEDGSSNPQDGAGSCKDVLLRVRVIARDAAQLKAASELVKDLKETILADHKEASAAEAPIRVLEGDVKPGFPLRACVLGKGGENLRHISDKAHVRITLEGRGSRPDAPELPATLDAPLSLRILRRLGCDRQVAMEMVRDLLEHVREEHDAWLAEAPNRLAPKKEREWAAREAGARCLAEAERLRQEAKSGGPSAAPQADVEHQAKTLERQAEALKAPGRGGAHGIGGFCTLFALGACPFRNGACPRGRHGEPPALEEVPDDVFVKISRAKKRLLQQKWEEAGGSMELVNVWQVRNPRVEFLFRAAKCDFAKALGHSSDVIDAWHGTSEANLLSIAVHGFDPRRRSGQVYGAGEYFAKDPNVSIGYACGGSFMFLCRLLLGAKDKDHTWVDSECYYVLKQRGARIQALPLFLVQFKESAGEFVERLGAIQSHDTEATSLLAARQRGGLVACVARRDAGMTAASTRHLWVGWLAPELCAEADYAVAEDVEAFLEGVAEVTEVVPERDGARIGAFVLLSAPIDRAAFERLQRRRYRGEHLITVDDQQPGNPHNASKVCPRFTGPSHYCRGWNLHGHHAWQWGCSFLHPEPRRATYHAKYTLEPVPSGTAKYDEIETELMRSAPFTAADGSGGCPRIVAVRRILNEKLGRLYEERSAFLHDKHGFVVEKELWHGTNCKALPELLKHGPQPPSDTMASDACPRSGKRGLCTTLCGTDCAHCREAHSWDRCHMYGLGVYLACQSQKSHRYVREPRFSRAVAPRAGQWQVVYAGRWRDFSAELCVEFDAARTAGKRVHRFSSGGKTYNLELVRMKQINIYYTNRERDVRCFDAQDAGEDSRNGGEDEEEVEVAFGDGRCLVYSMLRCRVCLGNPYLIEGNLLKASAMHDMCWCQDPSDTLESCAETWGIAKGHDAYFVRGMAGAQKAGLGVYNSEYIVFHPYQILPLYQVDYVLE